jgi:hypothetical protein
MALTNCCQQRNLSETMQESEQKPVNPTPPQEDAHASPDHTHINLTRRLRRALPIGLALLALVIIAAWYSRPGAPATVAQLAAPAQPSATPARDTAAAIPRIATAPAPALPTPTPTPAAVSALIALPTVTPTLPPPAVATRTVELRGEAMLRLQLAGNNFQSSGRPVTLGLEPRSYILGGNILTLQDRWCIQAGPSGVVFDLTYTLLPITEDLRVEGELQLYDGFCGSLGNLGEQRATSPLAVTIPANAAAQLVQSLQADAGLLGTNKVLNTTTGVFLELTIRNPGPR